MKFPFLFSDSGEPPQSNLLNCDQAAPFLMALFDGEADEIGAQQARRHLLLCPRCADSWRAWSENQAILRALPTPAPPPFLLWRVLLSCRFSAWKKRILWHRKLGGNLLFPRSHSDKAQLGALYQIFEPREAPADLHRRILTQTTRRDVPVARAPLFFQPRFSLPALLVPALGAVLALALSPERSPQSPDSFQPVSTPAQTDRQKAQTAPALAILPARNPANGQNEFKEPTRDSVVAPKVVAAPALELDLNAVTPEEKRLLVALPAVAEMPRQVEIEPLPEIEVTVPRFVPKRVAPVRLQLASQAPAAPPTRRTGARSLPLTRVALASFESDTAPSRVARPSLSTGVRLIAAESSELNDEGLNEIQSAVADFRAVLVSPEETGDSLGETSF